MFNEFAPQERHFRYLMISWLFFSTWAAIIQLFFQKRLSSITSWGHSPGWQREIGLWNIGAIIFLIFSLNSAQPIAHITIPVIYIWSLFFGINHFVSFLRSRSQGHLSAFILNIGAVIWATIIFLT